MTYAASAVYALFSTHFNLRKLLPASHFLMLSQIKVRLSLSKKKIYFICFNDSPLKMMKNTFYYIKAVFILKVFKFLSWVFSHVENQKYKVNFKIYDITTWLTNNYNTYIALYLTKLR